MEVLGKDAEVRAILRDANGAAIGERTYPVPAFAQQIITRTEHTASVELIVSGTGVIVAQTEGERRRAATSTTSTTSKATLLAGLPASFKAAPFQEPLTDLVLLRDRWYDPKTGTFLWPDPEGYADSANPYVFGKVDPANQHDPTGRHSFVKRRVRGIEFELLAPDAAEVRKGELGLSGSFTNPFTGKRETCKWPC